MEIVFEEEGRSEKLKEPGKIGQFEAPKAVLEVKRSKVSEVAADLLKQFPVEDLNIIEPDIEDIIREVFAGRSLS